MNLQQELHQSLASAITYITGSHELKINTETIKVVSRPDESSDMHCEPCGSFFYKQPQDETDAEA